VTRKLPAAAAFSHAVASVKNNLPMAFRIAWPWYAIIIPITLALYLLLASATGGNFEASPGLNVFASLLAGIMAMVSASSIAVNWHRYILRDEIPRGSEVLRLDETVWRYFGNMLLILLSVMAVLLIAAIPLSIIAALAQSPALGVVATLVLGVPIAGALFLRLAVKLPAIALGRTDFFMRNAWQATEGNNAPVVLLFVLNALIVIGAIAAVIAVRAVFSLFGAVIEGIAEMIAQVAVNWIVTIFGVTILTSLYGFFVENRDF
jgi:hypothetical protein